MNAASLGRKSNKKKQSNFQILLQNLRNKIVFKSKGQTNCEDTPNHSPSQILNNANDVLPVTQDKQQNVKSLNKNINQQKGMNPEDNYSIVMQKNNDFEGANDKSYTNIQNDFHMKILNRQSSERFNNKHFLLKPERKLNCSNTQRRAGGIVKQSFSINRHFKQHSDNDKQTFIDKLSLIVQQQNLNIKSASSNISSKTNSIKMLDDGELIKYLNFSKKLTEKSQQNQISQLFQGIIDKMNIQVSEPCIRKYKNCVYFGNKPSNNIVYEGFIYYFQDKIYYGELLNGIKHGNGVQIDFKNNSKYAGTFHEGKKTGYFSVQKGKQNYEGQIQFGIYHGKGKLMTEDYVYTGSFQNGKKHGYGQQMYPKTGLNLKGYFNNGIYSNFSQISRVIDPTSQNQLSNKLSSSITKSKSYLISFQILKKRQANKVLVNKQILQKRRNLSSKEDSQSVFDLITNNQTVNKYDINYQGIINKLPKIYVNDVLSKQSYNLSQGYIINNKIKQEDNYLSNNNFFSLIKKTMQYPSKASFVNEVQGPLLKHPVIRSLNFSK